MQAIILDDRTDLDALSSAYGLTLLQEDMYIVLSHALSPSVRLVLNRFKEKFKNKILKEKDLSNLQPKKIFVVDTNDTQNLTEFLKKSIPIIVYDHHPILKKEKGVSYHVDMVGSTTTLIVEELIKKGINIDPDDATILALGIYEDTGSFTYTMTTSRDLKATAYLVDKKADLNFVRNVIEEKIDEDTAHIIEQLIENLYFLESKEKKVVITYATYDKYVQDISSVFHLIKPFEEADAVFAVINFSGKISIIGRSKTKDIDAGKILSFFGGGGHYAAASATVKGLTTNDVVRYLEDILLIEGFSDLTIENIMNKKFDTVDISQSIESIPSSILEEPILIAVDSQKKFVGVIFPKVVKEAVKHGLTSATVENFVIDELVVFFPNTRILEAEKELSKYSQDFFPVIKEGYPVGIVSRFDILKAAHGKVFESEKEVFISRKRLTPKKANFKKQLNKYIPKEILDELVYIGKIAKKLNFRAYLVGGIVRDIILGKKNLDIDIIVEGDAITLVKEYAKSKGYSFYIFEEFMTGQVKLPNGVKFDFATARKESYEYPGAYPKVEKASIKEDLFRRDFTINTLAIEITEGNFGILLDYFNGLRDIKDRVIRVLHQLSFIEDPIRILRGLRFAGRLGFKLGKTTEKLLKLAVEQNILKTAPAGRINLELTLTFSEEKVIDIIILMSDYHVLHQLIPEFFLDEKREEVLVKLRDLMVSFKLFFDTQIDKSSLYLLALMYHLPLDISYRFLEDYFFHKAKPVFKEFYEKREILTSIPEKNSQLYSLIKTIKRDVLIFLSAVSEIEISQRIIEILKKEQEKKFIISGKDLKDLGLEPSPLFKDIIEDVFKKFLDDEIKNKKEALDYIKSKYLEKR
ncbi:MAG: CBS domain-containing protein [Aquificae bacterium]|nr:CBS domain-containing protein [Aquificota bacterium]